jgi:hypothetical protein
MALNTLGVEVGMSAKQADLVFPNGAGNVESLANIIIAG